MRKGQKLSPGLDYRLPAYRREVFLRFYQFHTARGTHPGCVYFLLPYLARKLSWDPEEAYWFAFLNGNTQHPPTSLLFFRKARVPSEAGKLLDYFREARRDLRVDADRRWLIQHLPAAIEVYLGLVKEAGGSQEQLWKSRAEGGWEETWETARRVPSFGRLSAWSYLEYLRIIGLEIEPRTLLLEDLEFSRSHRNGLVKVLGRDDLDWAEKGDKDFARAYTPAVLEWLRGEGEALLGEARERGRGKPWERHLTYFTLESALCTFKSFFRENRRYPNVYADMLYSRLRHPLLASLGEDLDLFWEARRESLPPYLRLEDNPTDPGCVPVKQNWFRETGEIVMMDREWACFQNGFREKVWRGEFGVRRV